MKLSELQKQLNQLEHVHSFDALILEFEEVLGKTKFLPEKPRQTIIEVIKKERLKFIKLLGLEDG